MTRKQYALLGFMAPLLFVTTYVILAGYRPEYHFSTKAISELGAVGAPHKNYWNLFGYGLPGLFIALFGLGLYRAVKFDQTSKLPLVGICLSGVFMVLAGVFPGDFENRQSTTMLWHTVGSFGSYLFFLVGAFTYVKPMSKSVYWKRAIKPTLICTWLTIVFGAWVFVFPEFPAVGQRVVFAFYFLWIVITAYYLFGSSASTNEKH